MARKRKSFKKEKKSNKKGQLINNNNLKLINKLLG